MFSLFSNGINAQNKGLISRNTRNVYKIFRFIPKILIFNKFKCPNSSFVQLCFKNMFYSTFIILHTFSAILRHFDRFLDSQISQLSISSSKIFHINQFSRLTTRFNLLNKSKNMISIINTAILQPFQRPSTPSFQHFLANRLFGQSLIVTFTTDSATLPIITANHGGTSFLYTFMIYTKQPLDYSEIILQLKSRGLIFRNEAAAKNQLKN